MTGGATLAGGIVEWRAALHARFLDEYRAIDHADRIQQRWVNYRSLPLPPDAVDYVRMGHADSAMPFLVGAHEPLIGYITHEIHVRRHYAVYVGRLRATTARLETEEQPGDETVAGFWRWWFACALHEVHWRGLPLIAQGMEIPDRWRRAASRWNRRLPSVEGFLLAVRDEGGHLRARWVADYLGTCPAGGAVVAALDLFKHAYFFDGKRERWLAAWLTLTEAAGTLTADELEELAEAPLEPAGAAAMRAAVPEGLDLRALLSQIADMPSIDDAGLSRVCRIVPSGFESFRPPLLAHARGLHAKELSGEANG